MLHELDHIAAMLDKNNVRETERLLRRLTSTVRLFIPKLSVLETMIPSDFIQFRDNLKPASGFQSKQFREVVVICGARDPRYLAMFDDNPDAKRRLEARLGEPSLWDRFVRLLERLGMEVGNGKAQEDIIVQIYSNPDHHELKILCEAMIEYDEMFSLWREHHVRMAQRMIGQKPGTGQKLVDGAFGQGPLGTMGVEYLSQTLDKRFFPVLWAARTGMWWAGSIAPPNLARGVIRFRGVLNHGVGQGHQRYAFPCEKRTSPVCIELGNQLMVVTTCRSK